MSRGFIRALVPTSQQQQQQQDFLDQECCVSVLPIFLSRESNVAGRSNAGSNQDDCGTGTNPDHRRRGEKVWATVRSAPSLMERWATNRGVFDSLTRPHAEHQAHVAPPVGVSRYELDLAGVLSLIHASLPFISPSGGVLLPWAQLRGTGRGIHARTIGEVQVARRKVLRARLSHLHCSSRSRRHLNPEPPAE